MQGSYQRLTQQPEGFKQTAEARLTNMRVFLQRCGLQGLQLSVLRCCLNSHTLSTSTSGCMVAAACLPCCLCTDAAAQLLLKLPQLNFQGLHCIEHAFTLAFILLPPEAHQEAQVWERVGQVQIFSRFHPEPSLELSVLLWEPRNTGCLGLLVSPDGELILGQAKARVQQAKLPPLRAWPVVVRI